MVLDIKPQASTPKSYFSHTKLPNHINGSQPPTRQKPFSSLRARPCYHGITLLAPKPHAISTKPLQWAKASLSLLEILEGDFFNTYIKTGNVLLVSGSYCDGTTFTATRFRVVEGVLRMDMDKAIYERAGLQGSPLPNPHGGKHATSLYRVEMNLRLPSMVSGKPGFERLKRAAREVFADKLTWLFYDFGAEGGVGGHDAPVMKLGAQVRDVAPQYTHMEEVQVPPFPKEIKAEDDVEVTELLEWIALTMLDSPRVHKGDQVDELLCRYSLPEEAQTADLVCQSWRGFLPAKFVVEVFGKAVKASADGWFAMKVEGFDGGCCMVLKTDDGRAMTWDCE